MRFEGRIDHVEQIPVPPIEDQYGWIIFVFWVLLLYWQWLLRFGSLSPGEVPTLNDGIFVAFVHRQAEYASLWPKQPFAVFMRTDRYAESFQFFEASLVNEGRAALRVDFCVRIAICHVSHS